MAKGRSAAAGRASVAAAHTAGHSGSVATLGRGGGSTASMTPAQRAIARVAGLQGAGASLNSTGQSYLSKASAVSNPTQYAQTLSSYLANMTADERSALQNQANSQVDPAINSEETYLQNMLAVKQQQLSTTLSDSKQSAGISFDRFEQNQQQATGEELRKQWVGQFADKGGGEEFGEGTGAYRGYANEAIGEQNRLVGQAKQDRDIAITRAQAAYDSGNSEQSLTVNNQIKQQEYQRTADRASAFYALAGINAGQYDLAQSIGVTNQNQPKTSTLPSSRTKPSGYSSAPPPSSIYGQ